MADNESKACLSIAPIMAQVGVSVSSHSKKLTKSIDFSDGISFMVYLNLSLDRYKR